MYMLLSEHNSLPFYGGVEHSIADVAKRWSGSVVWGMVATDQMPHAIYLDNFDDSAVEVMDALTGRMDRVYTKGVYVLREFPRNGVFIIDSFVYLVTRKNERQWARGCNDNTVSFDLLHSNNGVKNPFQSFVKLAGTAFNAKPVPFNEGIERLGSGQPAVVGKHLWMKTRDKVLASLYYDDVFIGMVDANKKFISHSESITLAEEAINELGLQAI